MALEHLHEGARLQAIYPNGGVEASDNQLAVVLCEEHGGNATLLPSLGVYLSQFFAIRKLPDPHYAL